AVKLERNIQPLSDDYIKFIRFAHWKMEKVERGVIGIITNNSFIDGLIHRGMRQELMKDFDEIYILNLHGNLRINEKCPDGSKDENVFDIKPGVCISFFIKKSINDNKQPKVFYQDIYGLRKVKYSILLEQDIKSINWLKIKPLLENYYFVFKNFKLLSDYERGKTITDIFKNISSGIKFRKDNLLVNKHFTKKSVLKMLKDINTLDKSQVIKKYEFSETNDWKFDEKKKYFIKNDELNVQKVLYRPFDIRFTYYPLESISKIIPRGDSRITFMKYMLKGNTALCIGRQWSVVGSKTYDIFMVASLITDMNLFRRGGFAFFPLYINTENGNGSGNGNGNDFLFKEDGKRDNFTKDFRHFIKSKYQNLYTPEQILGYIYAVLHSPTYRTKYIEFLKIDFPRIPFSDNENKFQELSKIGEKLINAHLLKEIPTEITCPLLGGGNNFKVEAINFDKGKVWFNNERYFDNVPEDVWKFFIGGYQVLDKWLKERKKHEIILETKDWRHFQNIINIITFTIKTMQRIDELTKDWI
ncbi:MAG: methyltransferase/helicase, partial [Ignavibacteria bacterium]|nr:methyltransferase/helicase [Ignavibacteria bacterium]